MSHPKKPSLAKAGFKKALRATLPAIALFAGGAGGAGGAFASIRNASQSPVSSRRAISSVGPLSTAVHPLPSTLGNTITPLPQKPARSAFAVFGAGGSVGKQSANKNVASTAVKFLLEQQLLNQKVDGNATVKIASTSGDNDASRRRFAHTLGTATPFSALVCGEPGYDTFVFSGANSANTFCSVSGPGGLTNGTNLAQCQALHDACNAPGHGAANNAPTVSNAPTDVTVTEDTASNLDLSSLVFADSDGDSLTVTLAVSAGKIGRAHV